MTSLTDSTDLTDELTSHLVKTIDATPLEIDPFPHLMMQRCFPESRYDEIVANLPDDSFYEPLIHKDSVREDGTSPRIQASLAEDRLPLLPEGRQREIWTAITNAFRADEVKLAFMRKLEPGLRERHTGPLESIEAYSRPALNRDVAGYEILPHPDTKAKVMSGLLYLPADESQRALGTSLYAPLPSIPGLKKRFRNVKTVPFAPNSGLIFAVTKRSFHGREPLSEGCGVRNYLALTYYDDPTRRGY